MGMTDKQFNAYIRGLAARLKEAEINKKWESIIALREELERALED